MECLSLGEESCCLGVLGPTAHVDDHMAGRCVPALLAYYRVAGDTIPKGHADNWFHSPLQILIPGSHTGSIKVICKLSLTMAEMANSTIQAIQDQRHSLMVGMDNWVTLDYQLAEQGRVCVTGNTSFCVYINNSGKVKKELEKIHIQVEWSSSVYPQSLFIL